MNDDERREAIRFHERELAKLIPDPVKLTLQQVDVLTEEQALEVLHAARRAMLFQGLMQETHDHLGDDCGDYLEAATSNWNTLWEAFFNSDGADIVEAVKLFLRETPDGWGGSDGEIRFSILPEEAWE